MSNSTKGRVQRGAPPKANLRKDYRKALPELLRDFQHRCAYSMQHESRAGGQLCMEIDHFNPTIRDFLRNQYPNLFLSTRHCNNKKRANWPKAGLQKKGVRFLNCCEEQDYGVHIFEDPDTHELTSETPAGRYHIRICDLNAPHFVRERKVRAEARILLEKTPAIVADAKAALPIIQLTRELIEEMIPPIPPPPKKPAQNAEGQAP